MSPWAIQAGRPDNLRGFLPEGRSNPVHECRTFLPSLPAIDAATGERLVERGVLVLPRYPAIIPEGQDLAPAPRIAPLVKGQQLLAPFENRPARVKLTPLH